MSSDPAVPSVRRFLRRALGATLWVARVPAMPGSREGVRMLMLILIVGVERERDDDDVDLEGVCIE